MIVVFVCVCGSSCYLGCRYINSSDFVNWENTQSNNGILRGEQYFIIIIPSLSSSPHDLLFHPPKSNPTTIPNLQLQTTTKEEEKQCRKWSIKQPTTLPPLLLPPFWKKKYKPYPHLLGTEAATHLHNIITFIKFSFFRSSFLSRELKHDGPIVHVRSLQIEANPQSGSRVEGFLHK